MNALARYLRSQSLTGKPDEIVAALDTDVELSRDTQRWTYAGLAKRFGPQIVGQIDEGLKQIPGMDWVRLALAAGGIDFSDSATQAGLDSLSGVLPSETIAALKAIGITYAPRWQVLGLGSLPTEDDVKFAQQQVAVAQWAAKVQNEIITPMVAGGSATVDDIKAAVAALEA